MESIVLNLVFEKLDFICHLRFGICNFIPDWSLGVQRTNDLAGFNPDLEKLNL